MQSTSAHSVHGQQVNCNLPNLKKNQIMQACLTSDTFYPTDELVKARLKLLTKQQTQVASSSLMSDLKEIILQYILATKFHISLANAVVINSRECRGSLAYANTRKANARRNKLSFALVKSLIFSFFWTKFFSSTKFFEP